MAVQYPKPEEIAALGSLSGEQRQYLNAAYTRGLSGNAALAELSAAGLGIRRTDGLAAYRAIGGVRSVTAGINNTPFAFQPSARLFVPAGNPIGYQFRIWAKVDAVNLSTGEITTLHVVVGSDTLLTRQQWLELAAENLGNASDVYDLEFATEDITITTAESNPQ